jgi:outer membrane lipoprotein LolB
MIRPLAVILLGLLAACATTPPLLPAEAGERALERRREALASLKTWTLTGRIAIQTEDEGWNATLKWRQAQDAFDIRIAGPFGGGGLSLQGGPHGVVMRTAEQDVYYAADAETLLYEHSRLALPVEGLRLWVLGLPSPGQSSQSSVDVHGRLTKLSQAGWEMKFLRYAAVGDIELPTKIFLSNESLEVRLVVDTWDLGNWNTRGA